MRPALVLAALLLAPGCQCSRDPYAGDLSENVGRSFQPCNASEIGFLAAKHNVQLVFDACGANKFSSFAWSPDGLRIFFQLVLSANVMDANSPEKRTVALPIPAPVGEAAWLSSTRLAIPVVAAQDEEDVRVAVHDLPTDPTEDPSEGGVHVAGQVTMHALPGFSAAGQLARGAEPGVVWFAGRQGDDAPTLLRSLDTTDGTVGPAVPHDIGPFTTFTREPAQGALVLGHEGTVRVLDEATGEVRHTITDGRRGILHPDGRWLVVEHAGETISVFNQRAWGELSDEARAREAARAEQFAERLPEHFDRTIQPPTLSLVDLTTGSRWVLTAVQGDHFAWYGAADDWASFFLWGFEGKQMKRNVTLASMRAYMDAAEAGTERMGLERYGAAEASPDDDAPDDDDDAAEDGDDDAAEDGDAPEAAPVTE